MILSIHGIIGSQIVQATGLLAEYPGAAAAYSLRLLTTAYTGSAIEVRRAVDNLTLDIGFVDNELDTASLETFCSGTNGFVTTWYDQSGNARDAAQATAANQPQIVSSGSVILENGKPSIEFDGSNDYLQNLGNTILLRERSFVFVGKQNSYAVDRGIISFKPIGSSNDFRSPDTFVFSTANTSVTPTRAYKIEGSTSGSYGLQKDGLGTEILQYGLYLETKTSGEGKLYENGTLQATDTSFTEFDTSNTEGYVLGARNFTKTTINNWLNGRFQEFIYWEVNNISNRTGIETNINNFYSIY